MKKWLFSGLSVTKRKDFPFFDRCFRWSKQFFFLSFLSFAGVLGGAFLAAGSQVFFRTHVLFLFFSGIPLPEAGFFSCFSTLLLNLLIFLTVSFFFGLTAFGAFAVPVLTLLKGAAIGIGVSSFLWADGLSGWGRSAFTYMPAAAVSLFLFLLFEVRALVLSEGLRKTSFSSGREKLDFFSYWKDYLCFLCLAVGVSFVGGGLAFLSSLFLSLS